MRPQADMFAAAPRPAPAVSSAPAPAVAIAEHTPPAYSGESLLHPLVLALDRLTEIGRLDRRHGPVALGMAGWQSMLDVLRINAPPRERHTDIERRLVTALERLIANSNADADGNPTVTLPAWQAARACLGAVCDAIHAGRPQAPGRPA